MVTVKVVRLKTVKVVGLKNSEMLRLSKQIRDKVFHVYNVFFEGIKKKYFISVSESMLHILHLKLSTSALKFSKLQIVTPKSSTKRKI